MKKYKPYKELELFISDNEESELIEYKTNLNDGHLIGKYISALANASLIAHEHFSYLIWGIEDKTKKPVGTSFDPEKEKVKSNKGKKTKGMPLITFLEKMIDPRLQLRWEYFKTESGLVIISLIIDTRFVSRPVKFLDDRYVRSGSSLCSLDAFPEKERELWRSFDSNKFELQFAKQDLRIEEIGQLIDINFYKEKCLSADASSDETIESLIADKIIVPSGENFNITNLGAYTLALDLTKFPTVLSRTIRITRYEGNRAIDNAIFDQSGTRGIAISFENIIKNIMRLIPYYEDYNDGIREDIPVFPEISIRELVANALVHQDFTLRGSRPLIEIFNNRIEISNPGIPIIPIPRFLDFKPQSRNEELANLLGKFHIVESRGTGIDKVIDSLEGAGLPAPDISEQDKLSTVIKLKTKTSYNQLSSTERINIIYWHACLNEVEGKKITNSSIRERFSLNKNKGNEISKLIIQALEEKLIKIYDPKVGSRSREYIPFWAKGLG